VSPTGHPTGHRRFADLPAATLAHVRQQSDPLCLLVCEPDVDVVDALLAGLAGVNVNVVCSRDGARALLDAGLAHPELVVLSAELPLLGAPLVTRTLRQVSDAPIVVGAGDRISDEVSATVAAGANRVMFRPYDASVLRGMMLALRASLELDNVALRAGSLTVDPLAYEVAVGGRRVPMSVRELEVLVYLMRHADRVVTADELRHALWSGGDELSPKSNAVAVTILRLRSRLSRNRGPDIIRTVRRRGYRFYPPTSDLTESAQPG
jgi:two-component system, OmpR family, response regulator